MNASRLCLYSVEWQAIRVSMRGNWSTPRGVVGNIETLQAYLKGYLRVDVMRFTVLWRVLNCLNAVRMGYSGQGLRDSKQDEIVRTFRNSVSREYYNLRPTYHSQLYQVVPTAHEIETDWHWLDPTVKEMIVSDLRRRLIRGAGSSSREELTWFLDQVGGVKK